MNLNARLPWPESWRLARVYLRPPTPGHGLFTLVKAIYLGPTTRGVARAQLELQRLVVERCLPSPMSRGIA